MAEGERALQHILALIITQKLKSVIKTKKNYYTLDPYINFFHHENHTVITTERSEGALFECIW